MTRCPKCDEWRKDAMRQSDICANCESTEPKYSHGVCLLCSRSLVPLQRHHIAGKQYCDIHVTICRSCHAVEAARQSARERHHPSESTIEALLYGIVDMVVVWLNWHRINPIIDLTVESVKALWISLIQLFSTYVHIPNSL
jgi:hypothetical protein